MPRHLPSDPAIRSLHRILQSCNPAILHIISYHGDGDGDGDGDGNGDGDGDCEAESDGGLTDDDGS